MPLTNSQIFLTILAVAVGAVTTRFLPFILFPENKKTPAIVLYLGRVLPPSMMGLLVVYCLRNTTLLQAPYGLPALIAIATIVILHHLKHNVLLSIAGGTAVYMFLVQCIF